MQIQTKYGPVHVLTACPLLDSTETLEFLTEVHESYNGSEDRNNLRDRPRQILNFNYVNFKKAMGDMFHMLYANLRKQWGIPLKQCVQNLPIVDGDFIPFDTSKNLSDLNLGYAFIQSKTENLVVEIISIGRMIEVGLNENDEPIFEYEDGFQLSEAITIDNATICPLRVCIIDNDVAISAGGFWANQQISFRVLVEDMPEIDGPEPAQFLNEDIYFKCLLLEGDSLSMTLTLNQIVVDGDIGGFQDFTNWKNPRYLKPFRSVLSDEFEYFDYKAFLYRRLGKYKAFWLPLYEQHLNAVSAGNNWIEVDNDYVIEADRKHIAVKINGIWSAHTITNKVQSAGKVRLNITPSLNATLSQVQSLCYLGLYRLAADTAELSFLGGRKAQVSIPIVELNS